MTSFSRDEYVEERFDAIEISDSDVRFKLFDQCDFKKCRFNSTRFLECRFSQCEFVGCDLSLASLKGCSFSGVTFKDCKLVGINWTEANWQSRGLLKPVAFDDCTLNYSTFIGLKLPKLVMTGCVAHDVDFSEATLTGAKFQRTEFTDSRFLNTDLTEADFTGARQYSINAGANKLKKTKFALPEAIALLRSLDIILVDEDE